MEYHIGNCKGPCVGTQSEEEYLDSIGQIRRILKGHLGEVKRELKEIMHRAAEELKFEEAQRYKEKLDLLSKYQSKSTIVSPTVGDVEVYSISSTEKQAFVNFLRISQGIIVISRNVEVKKKMGENESEILEHVIGQMRQQYGDDCPQMITSVTVDWPDPNITILEPKAGDKRRLLDLSIKNAMLYRQEKLRQYEKLNPQVRVDRLMEKMREDLRLNELPRHIECFDNSNFQGTYPVSACVVFKDGKPAKQEYRHFNIKTVQGPDDFATMKEAITRRYTRLMEQKEPLPQLLVVDGGKGQLSAAIEALKEINVYSKLAVIGIAKRLEELYYPNDPNPLYIDKRSETLKVIQHMRDEAHRFGITHHRKRRDKGTLKSSLTDIPGIGPAKAKLLLKEFKSVSRIKSASMEILEPIVGKQSAESIVAFYHVQS